MDSVAASALHPLVYQYLVNNSCKAAAKAFLDDIGKVRGAGANSACASLASCRVHYRIIKLADTLTF